VLGRLDSALGRHDDAEARFTQALAANETLGAVAMVVRTRIDHAHALAARGEDARAAEQLAAARAEARELGLAGLAA
jgi:hypothetical protein